MNARDVLSVMEELAPPELACGWDNIGLLVDAGHPVTAVLVTLDITPAVVKEAAEKGCGLIVAHHPVIFDPLKHIAFDDVPALLLQNGISAICMHTNLDAAGNGVNDVLADLMGLDRDAECIADLCGRFGELPALTTAAALAARCSAMLGPGVRYVEADHPVRRLAVVSGAGGSFLTECIERGADCLVTGEAAHHIALLAKQKGIGLVVAGHWATEHPVVPVLTQRLGRALPGITVTAAESDTDPFAYLEC